MRLLTNPSSLDDGGEHAQARRGGEVGKIVFLPSRRAVFADEPGLVPRQMLLTLVPDPLRWSVGRAHTHSRKAALSFPFVPVRQLMFCHLASASISSAAIDRMFGTCR